MGRKSQQLGKTGELLAIVFLKSLGARCIEKIPTQINIVKGKPIYTKKSSVDITCAIPYKRSCQYLASRIEVKLCDEEILSHSRLKGHQIEWLMDWHKCGLCSWVIWVHRSRCFMFRYPTPEFQHGKPLKLESAEIISQFKN